MGSPTTKCGLPELSQKSMDSEPGLTPPPQHTHTYAFCSFKYFGSVLKLENISFGSFYQNLHMKSELRDRCCLFLTWRLDVSLPIPSEVPTPVVHKPSTSGGPCLTLASSRSSGSHLATPAPWPRSLGFFSMTSCFVLASSHLHGLI